MKITIEFYMIQINLDSRFHLQLTSLIFGTKFQKKYTSGRKQKKKTSLLNSSYSISLSKYQFSALTAICNFQTKFAEKGGSYFQPKRDKIDTTIEFCIFKLVFVSNLTFNKQFCIFGLNLSKKNIYGQKQKKRTSSLNSTYLNQSQYQISA